MRSIGCSAVVKRAAGRRGQRLPAHRVGKTEGAGLCAAQGREVRAVAERLAQACERPHVKPAETVIVSVATPSS
jgi:hypothetical protein